MNNTTNSTDAEIVLADKGGQRVIWLPGRAAPLQIRRGTKTVFAARTAEIWEWSETPASHRARAEAMAKRAGRTINADVAVVAYDCPNIYLLNTPEIAARIRELLPAARRLHEESVARAAAEEAERAAALERRRAEVRAACPADCEPCTTGRWFDGLIECIAADGTRVDQWDDIDRHDCGIAYVSREILDQRRARDAEERAAAAQRAAQRAEERAAAEARAAAAHDEARRTGRRVLIRSYATTDGCHNGNDRECSLDMADVWALPDGGETTTYRCTF